MDSGNKTGIAIVTLVVGLLVGGGIGYSMGNNKTDGSSNASMTTGQNANTASAESDGVLVGGAKMVRTKDIVDNAVNAKNVTTVVAAVKAAGLVDTLKGPGPFTVFAPNNGAFDKLPAGTVDTLLKPENKEMLTSILTYHVVSGTYTSADLTAMASKGETLTSVQGGILTPVMENNELKIKDAKGNAVTIETADVISSNGVTHVIDNVLMAS
ncbi:MAG TPA: fasciclin domain-containing protein [Candidatus Saccharimonadales bacterium]|jgi:uncharacterized surface protein with fasciclin (FAS1) repeats